jgi:hypothetical protein
MELNIFISKEMQTCSFYCGVLPQELSNMAVTLKHGSHIIKVDPPEVNPGGTTSISTGNEKSLRYIAARV